MLNNTIRTQRQAINLMARQKRQTQNTQTLLGFYVTPEEKKIYEKAKPCDKSMSEFIREMTLNPVKRSLMVDKNGNKQAS